MFYPYGGGSSWLLYIGVPLIIGIWAQIRVSGAFKKWGEVRASSNITGAECAREILQAPLKMRMAIVPVTMIASQMLPFVIFGGLFFHMTGLITLGIYCYLILLVFQLITLPVEFDASRRAKIILREMGIIQQGQEAVGVNKVLNAAALTYVAAFIAALGNLLWLLSIRGDRR